MRTKDLVPGKAYGCRRSKYSKARPVVVLDNRQWEAARFSGGYFGDDAREYRPATNGKANRYRYKGVPVARAEGHEVGPDTLWSFALESPQSILGEWEAISVQQNDEELARNSRREYNRLKELRQRLRDRPLQLLFDNGDTMSLRIHSAPLLSWDQFNDLLTRAAAGDEEVLAALAERARIEQSDEVARMDEQMAQLEQQYQDARARLLR